MIDITLYPQDHDWHVDDYVSFVFLRCKKCGYYIQERFVGDTYLNSSANYNDVNYQFSKMDRNKLLTCAEVIIKNILE